MRYLKASPSTQPRYYQSVTCSPWPKVGFRGPNRRLQAHQQPYSKRQCQGVRRPKIRLAVTIQVVHSIKIHVRSRRRVIRNRITIRAQISKRTTRIRAQISKRTTKIRAMFSRYSNWPLLEVSKPLQAANRSKPLAGPR